MTDEPGHEVEVMRQMAELLQTLDERARVRVLWWGLSRFCPMVPGQYIDSLLYFGRRAVREVAQ